MKSTLVLVGTVLAGNPAYYKPTQKYQKHGANVWQLRSVLGHRTDSGFQVAFGNHATNNANARPPLRSHLMTMAEAMENVQKKHHKHHDNQRVMLEAGDDEDHSGEFFKVTEGGKLGGGGYERVTTSRFAADSDDIFMRSMIEQYALEGKNKDGSPNGQFWMDESAARAAASEVLHTHKKLTGAARTNYMRTYFPRTWAHFDVNRTGKIEVIKMPQFMRFLCSDQQMYLW